MRRHWYLISEWNGADRMKRHTYVLSYAALAFIWK